ncbi:ABC transporter permease [Bacillus marinisedimentorum]|uniref:ABC transporter permease n=1 Tax=Bacillus marinisedimentorum TaxID=1821260 RepID=UPI000872D267|nr:ABC transporter permease [Bacillus marinisedimentorum]
MRIRALIIRISRQILRDKRTLALLFLAPAFVLWLMSLVFNGEEYHAEIAVTDMPDRIIEQLKEAGAEIREVDKQEAMEALSESELDAYVTMEGSRFSIMLEGSDPSANTAVMMAMQEALQEMDPSGKKEKLDVKYLYGSGELELFDNIGPVLIGLFIFFFVFLLSGVSFLRERTTGTLERMLAAPIRRWEIVAGYIAGFGLFATIQAGWITWFSVQVLDILMAGSIWYVMLTAFLLAMTALTLGTLLSAFANNEFQMFQFIPLVIVPQVFFSGLFSLETMADWLTGFSKIMPLTYGADAMREVMIRGKGWEAIALDLYVLIGFSLVFMLLNILALKKHRKI